MGSLCCSKDQQVVDYLEQKVGMLVEMVLCTTNEKIDGVLEDGKLDVAFICSSPYVLDQKTIIIH